jgi:hypothetical protein
VGREKGNHVPPLSDSDRLAAYRDALGNWSFTDYIQFELTEEAYRWVRRELLDVTFKDLGRLMCEHVVGGGEIEEVPETRAEWRELHEFHYDLRLQIAGKAVYVETRLNYRLPIVADESWILVVNIHAP